MTILGAGSIVVSTHASVRRRPEPGLELECVQRVSTHASVRRRQGISNESKLSLDVSTHASVRRRHVIMRLRAIIGEFQLTPP